MIKWYRMFLSRRIDKIESKYMEKLTALEGKLKTLQEQNK